MTPSHRADRATLLLLMPFLLGFTLLICYPLARSLMLSFEQTVAPGERRFVGLANYRFLLIDKLFWLSVLNTLVYALAIVGLQVALALMLASLLDQKSLRGRTLYRLLFFLPCLVGGVFVAIVFGLLTAPRLGAINRLLPIVSGDRVSADIAWNADPSLGRVAIVVMSLWASVGFGVAYLLAAMQSVPRSLHEAAALDGAGGVRRFFAVTLPGVRPTLVFLIMVGFASAMQMFELPLIFFNGVGPRFAGLTVVMYLYLAGFDAGELGYAAAIGWALLLIVGLLLAPLAWRRSK